jgi:hypothetical protein
MENSIKPEYSHHKSWDYGLFREYLLDIGKGGDSLLPLNSYPDRFQLSPDWHQYLAEIKEATLHDQNERYFSICVNNLTRKLLLPHATECGGHGGVITKLNLSLMSKDTRKVIGSMHSHPKDGIKKVFSVCDLYNILALESIFYFAGFIEDGGMLFAFRCRETKLLPPRDIFSPKSFCEYWYNNNGFKYRGLDESADNIGEMIFKTSPDADPWDINKKIAQRHKLVFYGGNLNSDIVKLFPV